MKNIKGWILAFFHRKRLIRWGIALTILILLFLFRNPILRGIGFWLINEDPIERADAVVMLGGNPLERAPVVKKIMDQNYASHVYCTGSYVSPQFKSLGIQISEAQNSKKYLVKLGIPDSCIHALSKGTSTIEEAKLLLRISKQNKFKKIILVSSRFHTARVKKYFNKIFAGSGTQLIVRGAKPLNYSINTWWHSEEGLLFVNNEYVKSFYYWWNY